LCVPLPTPRGRIGALALVRADPAHPYTAADLRLAEGLAQGSALAVENARLFAAERRAHAETEAAHARVRFLADAGELFAASLDVEPTLHAIGQITVPAVADGCVLDL